MTHFNPSICRASRLTYNIVILNSLCTLKAQLAVFYYRFYHICSFARVGRTMQKRVRNWVRFRLSEEQTEIKVLFLARRSSRPYYHFSSLLRRKKKEKMKEKEKKKKKKKMMMMMRITICSSKTDLQILPSLYSVYGDCRATLNAMPLYRTRRLLGINPFRMNCDWSWRSASKWISSPR